jgi:hypothetical protein
MPAPSLIVTFTDTEGDEFPIRIMGTCDPNSQLDREQAARIALTRLDDLIEDGELIPSCPVKATEIAASGLWRVDYATAEVKREEG